MIEVRVTDAKLTTEHHDAIVYLIRADSGPEGSRCSKLVSMVNGKRELRGVAKFAKYWFPGTVITSDFASMCETLAILSRRQDCCVIRGKLRDPASYDGQKIARIGTIWEDAPRGWVALDLDSVVAPPDTDPIAWLAAHLPDPFLGVSFWYQWTSSYLITIDAPNLLRIRLWFRLSTPLDSEQCKALMPKSIWKNPAAPINFQLDHQLFNAVQPHFINAPTFIDGAVDPLPGDKRIGVWRGPVGDEVPIAKPPERRTASRLLLTLPEADAEDESTQATERERQDAIRRMESEAQSLLDYERHPRAHRNVCDLLALGCSQEQMLHIGYNTIRRPGTPYGREQTPDEVVNLLKSAYAIKAAGNLYAVKTPARQAFARVPVPETPVKLAEPIETPPDPEVEGKISFGKVALDNSVLLLETLYPKADTTKGFFRLENQDWIYHDGRYKPAGGETFEGEAQRLMMKEPKIVDAAVKVARRERHKAWKELPMWLDGRERPDPKKLILFENGMVNLDDFAMTRKAELIPHTSEFAAPYRLPYRFDPRATCPLFDQLLESIWPDDTIAREELCKMFGLMLVPITKYQKVFFFEGLPGSGKGTLTRVLQALVGEHNRAALQASSFLERFGLSGCLGKLLATVSEANPDERKDAALPGRAVDLIKSISGEDDVQVDRKGKEPFSGKLFCRFLLSANNAFKALDSSGALHRRLYLFRFEHKPASEDVNLTAKLLEELPGIANRAMEGLYRLTREDGFRVIPSSRDRMHALLRQQSPARNFAVENLRAAQPGDEPVAQGEVQAAFHRWCQSNGIEMNARNYILLDGIRAAGLDPAIITAGPALVHPHLAFVIPSTAASLME